MSTAARHAMAVLALGDRAEPPSYYEPFTSCSTASTTTPLSDSTLNVLPSTLPAPTQSDIQPMQIEIDEQSDDDSDKLFSAVVTKMQDCHTTFGSSTAGLTKLLQRLQNVATGSQWDTLLHTVGGGVPVRRRRGAIHVQPTAVSRRLPGVSRGSKRRASGRPAKSDPQRRLKRRRRLAVNVAQNQCNAKSHGDGH